ncbi:MAG: TlyA family RNA methyltransferase [Acidimicrobiia bacterium]
MSRRRLDVELVRRKLVESRTAAQRAIGDGRVEVGGIPEPKPATLVDHTNAMRLVPGDDRFVGRGGRKLDDALVGFAVDVRGRSAVDVGASTGGFTDCLLRHGVRSVAAVDVGYGQLHWSLRTDDRVTVFERTNIRDASPKELGAPFDVVTADLSFIGLRLVAGQLAILGDRDADWLLLVKPQFEAGRESVETGGVVRDPEARAAAVCDVARAFWELGLGAAGVRPSPVPGAKSGNREYVLWLRRDAAPPALDEIRAVVIEDG